MSRNLPAWFLSVLFIGALQGTARADIEPYYESAIFLVDTSVFRFDTDGDGMPDNYEIAVGLSPLVSDADDDVDGDGISNIDEYNSGTSPVSADHPELSQAVSAAFTVITKTFVADTDGDGMPDLWEGAHGLNVFADDSGEDLDNDGLLNLAEYNGGTYPQANDSSLTSVGISPMFTSDTAIYAFSLSSDTDGDGMPNWWEQKYQLDPLVDDASDDVDGDGISNVFEYQQGLNPNSNEYAIDVIGLSGAFTLNTQISRIDSDGDGMPDSWEVDQNLNVFGNDANEDPDGDGRTNLEEYNAGTNPLVDDWRGPSATASPSFVVDTGGSTVSWTTDTDGDGMPDWWEIRYGFNFESNDSADDADNDGISNVAEYNSGSNPIIPDRSSVIGISAVFLVDTGGRTFDSDADGIPDWWERLFFNDSRLANASDDSDNDGHSNAAEFDVGSNPLDANSVFKIDGYQAMQEAGATQILIQWASFEGSTYSIWGAILVEGPYSLIASNILATPPQNEEALEGAEINAFIRIKSQR